MLHTQVQYEGKCISFHFYWMQIFVIWDFESLFFSIKITRNDKSTDIVFGTFGFNTHYFPVHLVFWRKSKLSTELFFLPKIKWLFDLRTNATTCNKLTPFYTRLTDKTVFLACTCIFPSRFVRRFQLKYMLFVDVGFPCRNNIAMK